LINDEITHAQSLKRGTICHHQALIATWQRSCAATTVDVCPSVAAANPAPKYRAAASAERPIFGRRIAEFREIDRDLPELQSEDLQNIKMGLRTGLCSLMILALSTAAETAPSGAIVSAQFVCSSPCVENWGLYLTKVSETRERYATIVI
jgi:hypothetical protein